MSLKARVEAIIYAAEEPVTIEQIAALLREEVLVEEQRLAAEAVEAAAVELTEEEAALVAEPGDVAAPSVDAEALRAADEASENEAEASSASDAAPEVDSAPEAEAAPEAADGAAEPTADAAEATPGEGTEPDDDEEAPAAEAMVLTSPEVAPKRGKKEQSEEARVRAVIRSLVGELVSEYAAEGHGLEIRAVAGGYRMATKPEHHDIVRAFSKSLKPPVKLSLAALETLAVIAYKQPITVPEISEIRGVESGGVIGTLLDRKLISTGGRKQVIGRPILYKTSKEFLLRFGLNAIADLPSMEEFEKIAQEAQNDLLPEDAEPSKPSLDFPAKPPVDPSLEDENSQEAAVAVEPADDENEDVELSAEESAVEATADAQAGAPTPSTAAPTEVADPTPSPEAADLAAVAEDLDEDETPEAPIDPDLSTPEDAATPTEDKPQTEEPQD